MLNRDIRDVVAYYETSAIGKETLTSSRVERERLPTSQKCFSRVSTASEDGQSTSVFRYGDKLRLLIGMAGRTPHSTHFVEWFLNEPSKGNRVAWDATHAMPQGDISGDAKEISFLIGPLPLAEGKYSISLAMGVAGVIDLDFWHDAITLEIVDSDPENTGYHYTTRYDPLIIPYRLDVKVRE